MFAVLVLSMGGCATDANYLDLDLTLTNVSAPGALQPSSGDPTDYSFAPGIAIVHDASFQLFVPGQLIAIPSVEPMAEDGDPTALKTALADDPSVKTVQFLSHHVDEVSYANAPMHPGDSGTVTVEAHEGDLLTIAFMYGQSNDVLIATGAPIAVGTYDAPIDGDLTGDLSLWDMGTEVNEEPGIGPNQAPRQAAPGDGEAESAPVTEIVGTDGSGFSYSSVDAMASLTVAARLITQK